MKNNLPVLDYTQIFKDSEEYVDFLMLPPDEQKQILLEKSKTHEQLQTICNFDFERKKK
jgi:hypothetical protein